MDNRGMGALPPKGLEWTIGKTVATLDFVRDAEKCIAILNTFIKMCKTDALSFDRDVDVIKYLIRNSDI
jgi:hypothetical protein